MVVEVPFSADPAMGAVLREGRSAGNRVDSCEFGSTMWTEEVDGKE